MEKNKRNSDDILRVLGIEEEALLKMMFYGYQQIIESGRAFREKIIEPEKLITLYFSLCKKDIDFYNIKRKFLSHYINEEILVEQDYKLEQIPDEFIRELYKEKLDVDKENLFKAYRYILSDEINENFDLYTLNEINELVQYGELGTNNPTYRTGSVRINGSLTDVFSGSSYMISLEMKKYEDRFNEINSRKEAVRDSKDQEEKIKYLYDVVDLGTDLLKLHPYEDGNGRSVRIMMNKLFMDAGIPPVYIISRKKYKEQEETEKAVYNRALEKAQCEGNYDEIRTFYLYKICDSILELVIYEKEDDFTIGYSDEEERNKGGRSRRREKN